MVARPGRLRAEVQGSLWPLVESFLASYPAAGLAIAAVRDGEVVQRGFGVRDVGTRAPVTPETVFHLASVSKPFVATAVVSLATAADRDGPLLDLDAPVTDWVPELTLADGRQAEVTARGLLSHTSGLPDVSDYGWHDPRLDDDALSEFAGSLSGWRLQAEPGSAYSYSNAGFELLGLLLARVVGTTFEDAVRRRVLEPLGMATSTFLRAEVPARLAASPHVGMPLAVPAGAYPYTRQHAPSSSLHSNLLDLCRWMTAQLEPPVAGSGAEPGPLLDPGLLDLMRRPVLPVDNPPWEEAAALGWAVGTYAGHRTVSHSGMDPGFVSMLVLVPERRTGVVVLANANTVPAWGLAKAAIDVLLPDGPPAPGAEVAPGRLGAGMAAVRSLLPPVTGALAEVLAASGPEAAVKEFHRLAASGPAGLDLDDEVFVDAVWGAIELHRTRMVWPLLRVWTAVRPDSSAAWTMTGWARKVDGDRDGARRLLGRALHLDPGNDEAASLLRDLT